MTHTRSLLSRRSRRSSVLMATLAFSFLLFACRDGNTAGGPPADLNFKLKSLDGRTIGPKDFRGRIVVVDFWATWCIPCHRQAEILESLHKEYKGKPVQFLAANVGEDEATVRSFLKRRPIPYPVLLDPEDKVSSRMGVMALPTLIVIDKAGKVSYTNAGITEESTLRKILKQAGI